MRVLIVEDESIAAQQLQEFVIAHNNTIEVLPVINSCKKLKAWASKGEDIDVVFCDIELSDGNVLSTLASLNLNAAIIFTTAYDNFWSEALKINGIDYLLKPLSTEKVHQALYKLESLKRAFVKDHSVLAKLSLMINQKQTRRYKQRFPVRLRNEVFILETTAIIFFRITDGVIFAFTASNKKVPIGTETLNELEAKLDPEQFFRVNRSEIVNAAYIDSIRINDSTDYTILLKGTDEKLSVSNSRVNSLKEWLDNPQE